MAEQSYYANKATSGLAHSWLDYVCEAYAQGVEKWCYARDHYTGECVSPWKIPGYLVRKKIGETVEAYEERVLLADYTPHFGSVVDTLAGMLAAVDSDATRTFGKGKKKAVKAGPLGDVADQTTVIGRLWVDADGDGSSWLTIWSILATDLVAIHDAWVLVQGTEDGRDAHVRIIAAEQVTNWRYDGGVLVEAVLKEHVDARASVRDDPDQKSEDQWVEFTTSGWTRWRVNRDDKAKTEEPTKVSDGTYSYVTRAGKATIPLFPARLPLRRNVGYLMARKANAIFNKESERDHLQRFGAFPILNVFANDTTFKKVVDLLRGGSRVLQVQPGGTAHGYASPDQAAAEGLSQTIKSKEEAYYKTAFREFGASTRANRDRVTATEVKQDVATGVAAFLGLLKSAVDGAENNALWLLEQTVFPRDKAKWGLAKVERSSDFAPFDVNAVIDRLGTRYFGQNTPFPVGRTALIAAAKMAAEWDGLEATDEEIAAAVDKFIAGPPAPEQKPTQPQGA